MGLTLTAKQKKCIEHTLDLKAIGTPLLQTTDLKDYSYCRINRDGRYVFFSTHAAWLTEYFLHNFSITGAINECPNILNQKFSLWRELHNSTLVEFTLTNFEINNGITMVEQVNDYLEFFHFCSDKNTRDLTNWYLNNLTLLSHFAKYFRDKISTISKDDLYIQTQLPEPSQIKIIITQASQHKSAEQTRLATFHHDTVIKHAEIMLNDKAVELNAREIQCLELLLQGHTAKRAAEKLYLSPRTVECYLAGLKKKLNCHSKSELMSMILKTGIIGS